jgi:hypothetical protein
MFCVRRGGLYRNDLRRWRLSGAKMAKTIAAMGA